ncbi:Methanogenesis regulatory protein FilR1 [uncultured archaeon]|nr:Methanogenesis regulatory protein FilR1 [uncultured archaeon]
MVTGNDADIDRKINTQDILRLAICSDLRKNLLITLNEGAKSLGSLRDGLNISSTTALHALKELEKSNLIFKDRDKNYALTNIGRITTLKLLDFGNAAEVLYKYERFWLEHDLSGIPDHLLEKVGWLRESTIIEDAPTDIFKSHIFFVELLSEAKEIKGVSSIFHPEYPILIEELVNRKIPVEIIVTHKVFDRILEVAEKILKKIISEPNFSLYVLNEDTKIALTLTDSALHIGLFDNKGTYDYNKDIISYDDKAISWGRLLYEHYFYKSKKFYL